jgi:signal transduction histidine kinase
MRRHFFRRMALAVAAFFVLTFVASGIAVGAFTHAFGARGHRGAVPLAVFLTLALLVIGFRVARSLRRVAAPVGDVMEAADRVAGGDYSARVAERGPREMRRLASSFNAMTERLGANEEQRRNLLADLAHELRTPLSVIQGTAEGMLDGLYPADRVHLEPLVDEANVMSRLLDDLRLLSTAEAGALRLHRRTVEPGELVEEAVGALRSQAEAAGVALEADVEPGLPVMEADPVRIGEVLSNLVWNALRHTPAGGSVTVRAGAGDPGEVAFEVRDSGSGIAPEVLPHAFDRFVRGAGSGGAGLGLSIARSLVQAHGGRIWAESEPGKGTRVRFVIPAGESAGVDSV